MHLQKNLLQQPITSLSVTSQFYRNHFPFERDSSTISYTLCNHRKFKPLPLELPSKCSLDNKSHVTHSHHNHFHLYRKSSFNICQHFFHIVLKYTFHYQPTLSSCDSEQLQLLHWSFTITYLSSSLSTCLSLSTSSYKIHFISSSSIYSFQIHSISLKFTLFPAYRERTTSSCRNILAF